MKITIAGLPGSGKSTIGKMLAKKFKLKFMSIGDIRGKIALKHGLTLDELNSLGEKEAWTDNELDDYQKDYGKKNNNFVIDGRLSFYFIPDSIKIFLDVSPEVGAKRILIDNQRPDEKKQHTLKNQIKAIKHRASSDKKRYKKYYNIDPYQKKYFDIYIKTDKLTPQEVFDKIVEKIKK